MDEQTMRNLRIQDVVARAAGVNLRETVRVMRTLALVAPMIGEVSLQATLNKLLHDGAKLSNFPAPLHSKPDKHAIEACYVFYQAMIGEYGEEQMRALTKLETDPYFMARSKGG